ncbi:MAG: polyphenol oxidase family protein [Nitrospinae bacterium]|nr:polyphenol oxidase family protein [Nitrospinota bacterium]
MLVRHESGGIRWYSFAPLDELGFLANWVTTNRNGFNLAGPPDGTAGKNRSLANELFAGGRKIYLPVQEHGVLVRELSADAEAAAPADAVFTSRPTTPAGVLTADCLPIILADPAKKTAAVVHAGRKGIFGGIIGGTISAMKPRRVVAALGPAIRNCCYEVGPDVFDGGFDAFKKYYERGRLDLIKAALDQLSAAGVAAGDVHDSGICTHCGGGEFYSFRREGGSAGRFMTGLMILPPVGG